GIRFHGDCHPGNILWAGEALMFVDLDDARQGAAIQDLLMMLSGDRATHLLQLDTLVNAYEEFCDFDHTKLKL
ncbi:phosphotransferase, partial [Pseudoalteromonas sp. S1691]|uniref:phosphotransferase n=1 Tax=Pseudoalteromonas sp. S1691 TaxID=579513 RepID=UPI001485E8D1